MKKLKQLGLHPEQMLADLPAFMNRIICLADEIGISLSSYAADHIALRVNSQDIALELHQAWLAYGTEWSQAIINGRPIVVIGFDKPLQVGEWTIEALELPYPNGKTYPQQGWEHVEFVIPGNAMSLEQLEQSISSIFPALNLQQLADKGIKVKASSPAGEHERLPNPTYAFKKGNICIKLHSHSLAAVITSEKE
ncbi:VOC family protein [Photobacterium carnosum]|uniref:VOC family protein n=1 Tax=Photobacterium carnosum TaxID=2023717 RepID=UPI001E4E1B59|nr:VOC family protein [Photobacterium carnosum]MCD9528710.1 VOC family protein [Photobacterium carnosum]MCF2152700.1 VOC family protein [Photobacterium carnosum]MCF2214460.1 VOC family protein [Photobacterium carnosum]